LIENKVDLVSEERASNDTEIREFADKNNFIGVFRTSAKQGINVSEGMEFLIKHIIAKLEICKFNKADKKGILLKDGEGTKNKKCC
jgi:translation initiation factor 2 gamma subunit (eIF-2gamma)